MMTKLSSKTQKRFIAGATCPKCKAIDKIVVFYDEQDQKIQECVSCGHLDKLNQDQPSTDSLLTKELKTRVTPQSKAILDEDERPLRILIADRHKK